MKWWRRWDSNPHHSLARRMLGPLSYIPLAFPAGFEPASAGLEAAVLVLRQRKPMGQPASLELASRRWQRRALPVELCLPALATSQVVKERSACSGRVAGAAQKRTLPQINLVPHPGFEPGTSCF